MQLNKSTVRNQQQLAEYVRTGELNVPDGALENRLPQYRRLVYNVVFNLLSQAYPIARKVLGAENWELLVSHFFANHRCETPQVWKMPRELAEFVSAHFDQLPSQTQADYLPELLFFEWTEIEVHSRKNVEVSAYKTTGELLSEKLVLNPYLKVVQLQYPIHKLPHAQWKDHKGKYFIIVHRDVETHKVHFTESSPFGSLLLDGLTRHPSNAPHRVLERLAVEMNVAVDKNLEETAGQFLLTLQQKGIILGKKA